MGQVQGPVGQDLAVVGPHRAAVGELRRAERVLAAVGQEVEVGGLRQGPVEPTVPLTVEGQRRPAPEGQ